MNATEEISTMMDLGLTNNQARVYLALIELGPSKAEEISKFSDITRQDIYRVMPKLKEMGFVDFTISRPIIYKALPLQDALSSLINRREKETNELKKQTRMILKNHRNKISKKLEENYRILYIPGKKALINKTREAISKVKKSLYAVSSWNNVVEHMIYLNKDSKSEMNLDKNIEICFVTEKPSNVKPKLKSMKKAFSRKPSNVKIRYSLDSPQAHVLLIDQKEVFIRLCEIGGFAQNPSIWSNNPCLLEIAKSYFEKMWKNSVDPKEHKEIQVQKNKARSIMTASRTE